MPVENVYVFVADALRWDYLPAAVRDQGAVLKGIAASTMSPSAFSSLFSGQYPPAHGVRTFEHRLNPETNALLGLSGYQTSFWEAYDDADPIYDVLGQDPATKSHLEDIEPPFVHVEREVAAHSPYGYRAADETDQSASAFISERITDPASLRDSYEDGVSRVEDVFSERMATLRERGLADETLVIFLADHGELLGEYGEWAHTYPMVPELVYVPVVLCHPDGVDPQLDGPMSHVDVVPTIYDQLGLSRSPDSPGLSAYEDHARESAYCGYDLPARSTVFGASEDLFDTYRQRIEGMWDADGGWVFDAGGLRSRGMELLKASWLRDRMRRRALRGNPRGWLRLLWYHARAVRQFGDPGLTREEAASAIAAVRDQQPHGAGTQEDLGEAQRDRLKDLGYL